MSARIDTTRVCSQALRGWQAARLPRETHAGTWKQPVMTRFSAIAHLITLVAATTFFGLLAVPRVEATPISFTFQGTLTGVLGDSQFTAVPFAIIANGDTANIIQSGT